MIAIDEKEQMSSCLNRALPHEIVFTLLGRDAAVPETIRNWCAHRVDCGKNRWSDEQIVNALRDADEIEKAYPSIREELARV